MLVSVVVPNHGRDITALRHSVYSSTYKNVEFIEIDRGFERSKQRNIGIAEAKGEVILWLDSDQTISPDLIKECVELIRCGVTAVYVPEVIVGRSFFARIRAFERLFYTGTAVDVPRAVLKRVMPIPAFNEDLHGPEDALFGSKLPGIRAVSQAELYHHDDIGVFSYMRKKAYYSKSMRKYAELNPNDPCLSLKYRCFDVLVQGGKWKRLLRHPVLSACVLGLLIVRGIIYAANR